MEKLVESNKEVLERAAHCPGKKSP